MTQVVLQGIKIVKYLVMDLISGNFFS